MIFSLVVGHQFIHIMYSSRHGRLFRAVCKANTSEDEAYEEFMTGNNHVPADDFAQFCNIPYRDRHAFCEPSKLEYNLLVDARRRSFGLVIAEAQRKPMLNLSNLGACRQMYEEASVLFWTTNTFSFEAAASFRTFVDALHSTQITKLTRIHIDFALNPFWAQQWERSLPPTLISKLDGLRTLHATFDQCLGFELTHSQLRMLQPVSRMQILPLKHVTVVVGDHDNDQSPWFRKDRWTIAQKQEVAEGLRSKLLDPNGPAAFAAEMKAVDAEVEKERQAIGTAWTLPEQGERAPESEH